MTGACERVGVATVWWQFLDQIAPFRKKSKRQIIGNKCNVEEGETDILGWVCSDFGDCTTFLALVEKLSASGSNSLEEEVPLRI